VGFATIRIAPRFRLSLDDLYANLITEDIAMTTAIQQGTLTRSERRARLEVLLTEIRAAEDFQIAETDNQGKCGQNPHWSSQEEPTHQCQRGLGRVQLSPDRPSWDTSTAGRWCYDGAAVSHFALYRRLSRIAGYWRRDCRNESDLGLVRTGLEPDGSTHAKAEPVVVGTGGVIASVVRVLDEAVQPDTRA
jgi:hypothetical protein